MINLRNLIYENDKTTYNILSEIVKNCGIESVLSALSEISQEQYLQKVSYDDVVGKEKEINISWKPSTKILIDVYGRKYVILD